MKLLLFNRTSKRDTADFSYTLGSAPQILLASVQRPCLKRSSQQLKERWQVEILTSPLRLVSCSSAQPAAPALGLSAGAGLTPPVKRFAAAGRPAFICSRLVCAAKTPSNAMEIGSVSAPASSLCHRRNPSLSMRSWTGYFRERTCTCESP